MKENISLANNREILFSKSLLMLNFIATFTYIVCLLYCLYLFFYTEDYLNLTQRNHFIYLSFAPLLSFNYTFWVYENLYPNRKFDNLTIIKLGVFIFYLFIPSLILIFRYKIDLSQIKDWQKTVGLVVFIFGPLFLNGFPKVKVIDVILDICFRPWSNNLEPLKTIYFNKKSSELQRESQYLNKDNLDVFQESFTDATVEDIKTSYHIKSTNFIKTHNNISVLDIGGHNGIFTAKLLKHLYNTIGSIEMVDPIIHLDYQSNLKSLCNNVSINNCLFEEYTPVTEKKFDLIIASHSLYYFLDTRNNKEFILKKIKQFLSPNGVAIIILGSKNSPAYSLKSSIIEFILNEKNLDSTAESLIELIQLDTELKYTAIDIDNFINMTEILKENEKLCNWISYFTRTPKIVNEYDLLQIKKMIYYYSIEGKHMPDLCKPQMNNENIFLIHKTKAILLSTEASNVYKK